MPQDNAKFERYLSGLSRFAILDDNGQLNQENDDLREVFNLYGITDENKADYLSDDTVAVYICPHSKTHFWELKDKENIRYYGCVTIQEAESTDIREVAKLTFGWAVSECDF